MDIGLNILDNFKISIGESFESIVHKLKQSNIEYYIPYKSSNNYLLYIESYGIELRLTDNKISFIKTTNTELNYIMTIDNTHPVKVVNEIRDKLAVRFEISNSSKIFIDRFEANSFNSIITIPYDSTNRVKISLVLGKDSSIYIKTIELV